eukprot:scaffold125319_cov41-Tisochrysis_lutea.AAC.1
MLSKPRPFSFLTLTPRLAATPLVLYLGAQVVQGVRAERGASVLNGMFPPSSCPPGSVAVMCYGVNRAVAIAVVGRTSGRSVGAGCRVILCEPFG